MTILKQSTEIKVRIGPFVDATDGVTPETGVTLSGADQAEVLKANGAATVDISGATWAAITGCDGWYDLTLTTSHTDTVGELIVVVQDSSVALPVFQKFQVMEEAVYDALYGGGATGLLPANVTQISGDSTAADNAELFFDGTGYNAANSTIGTCTANTDMRGTDDALLAASAPTNFSDLAITATTGLVSVGSFQSSLDLTATMKASVNTEADTALSDYGALKPTVGGRTLDVTAGGNAGIDWANIAGNTTTVSLTNTTIGIVSAAQVSGIDSDVVNASALASDAVTEIQNGLATSANQTTILNRLGSWTGSGINTVLGAFRALFRKDADVSVPSDINADLGSGVGTADNAEDSVQAIRDRGDSAWITATGFSTLDAAGVRTAVGLASANLDTQLGDIPTVAEFEARTIAAADYFDPANDTVANVTTVGSVTTKTGYALTSDYDFAKGTVAMTEAYAANGATPTPIQALYAIQQYLTMFDISSTSYTVKKLDGSTTAFIVTLNDDTTPTAATRS